MSDKLVFYSAFPRAMIREDGLLLLVPRFDNASGQLCLPSMDCPFFSPSRWNRPKKTSHATSSGQ